MANIRVSAAQGGALATLLAADYFLVMKQSDSVDYSVTPAVLMNYMETGMTMTGTLACAAQTLSGSAVAFTGGTIGNVTLGITGGAITNCQVDNVNINGNTISTTAGIDLNIIPYIGQQIVLDSTIVIDAGVVTGIINITAATAVLTTINNDTITIGKTLSFDGTPQNLEVDGEVNATTSVTQVKSGAGARAITIANGTAQGQIKYIYFVATTGGVATLTDAVLNFSSIALTNEGEGCTLIWDNTNTKWDCVGCSGTFTA